MTSPAQTLDAPQAKTNSIILIGMAGAGKTTTSKALAERIGWAFLDTDHLIEAHYGTHLQNIADNMTKDEFLDVERDIVCRVGARRAVIATGGSVVYRQTAIDHLKKLGPIVYLDVSLDIILERISRNPDRGLAIAPGQTIEDLYNERRALYQAAADFTLNASELSLQQCVTQITDWLETR